MTRFRGQILAVLLLVALLPSLPAALTVRALFDRVYDPRPQRILRDGVDAGLTTSREWLARECAALRRDLGLPRGASSIDSVDQETRTLLTATEEGRDFLARATALAQARGAAGARDSLLLEPARLRALDRYLLVGATGDSSGLRLWARALPAGLEARVDTLGDARRLLAALDAQRGDIVRSLLLTFLSIYFFILLLVLGLGWFLSRRLTRPLEALAHGMDRVAEGDLSTVVPVEGGSPLARLLRHFNQTIARLAAQQEELRRLEKAAAWRDMARRLAHEIKNPLTPIQLAAQDLRDRCRTSDSPSASLLTEATTIIEEEAQSLRHLVDEFSRFARLPEPVPRAVSVDELLSDIGALYRPEQVSVQPPTGLIAWCDPDEMHRVLVNLVENALQAQTSSGAVTPVVVEAAADHLGATIRVLDRGPAFRRGSAADLRAQRLRSGRRHGPRPRHRARDHSGPSRDHRGE
ncbi:MAG: HAMP domain-containing protein [Candidatus Eisenbacteria bacterium]